MKKHPPHNWIRKAILLLLLTVSYFAILEIKGKIGGLIFHLIFTFTILMLFHTKKVLESLYGLCVDGTKTVSFRKIKHGVVLWLLWSVSVFVFFASYNSVWIARNLDPATIFFFVLLPATWLFPLTSNTFILSGILTLPIIASLLLDEETFAATTERYAILVFYFFAAGVVKNIVEIKKEKLPA